MPIRFSFQLVTGRTWKGSAFGGVKGRTEIPGIVEGESIEHPRDSLDTVVKIISMEHYGSMNLYLIIRI